MPLSLRPLLAVLLLSAGGGSRQLRQLQPGTHQRQQLAQLAAGSGSLCGLLCALRSDCTAVEYGDPPAAGCRLLGCDPDWTGHHGLCYQVSAEVGSQLQADQACRDLHPGALLTSILSEDEQVFIDHLAKDVEAYCIGLRHEPSYAPGEFRWLDGSTFAFSNWVAHQPDGNMNRSLPVRVLPNIGWYDSVKQAGFVCKYAA